MPDFGAPVAAGINAPNPQQSVQTLSGLLGVAQQQQSLQQGQQALQVGAGQVQQAQQQQQERQLLQTTMQTGKDPDGNPIKGANGEVDPTALAGFANKYLPLTGQGVQQGIIQTLNNRVQLNDQVRGLGQNFRNDISGIVRSGIGMQDPSAVMPALSAYAQQNPNAAPAISRAQALLQHVSPQMPQAQRDQALQHLSMEFQPAATTAAQQAPQMGTTTGPGGGVQAFNTNPNSATPVGAVGPEVAQGVPLGERSNVTTNPVTGGFAVVNKTGAGQVAGITNPPTTNVYNPSPGDLEQKPALVAQRQAAQDSYLSANTAHTNNQLVLQNIDNVAATGQAGQAARKALSVFGLNSDSDSSTAYDLVGKGLERSALQAAQSMGPNTNAGLDAQIKANGSLGYTPQAIKEVTKLNDALTSGVQAYQPGLERAIAADPAKGVYASRAFNQQWGANFDPNIFKYYNAIKSGDTSEQQAIVKQLGGLNSKGYNAMMQKAQNLQKLSNSGSLE
jgi:hypothetical protein